MVRASGSYPLCQGFKSLHRHHLPVSGGDVPAPSEGSHGAPAPLDRETSGPTPRASAGARLSRARLVRHVGASFGPARRVGIAFSGGTDSTALLWAATQVRGLHAVALHVDHSLDSESAARAVRAEALARELGAPFHLRRIHVHPARRRGESLEEAARRLRYEALWRLRAELGLELLATAHHADDQAETVILRLLGGSRLRGLAGIVAQRGALRRPLLPFDRATLEALVARQGLEPIADPTNHDLRPARNFVRHALLPHLEKHVGLSRAGLLRLTDASRGALDRLDARLATHLDFARAGVLGDRWSLRLDRFAALPEPLQRSALDALHRAAGIAYPGTAGALRELFRQLDRGAVCCDCGGGFRWRSSGRSLVLEPAPRLGARAPDFTYTLEIPGTISVPEIAAQIRVEPVSATDLPRSLSSAVFTLPGTEPRLEVRSSEPTDRLLLPPPSEPRRTRRLFQQRRISAHERRQLPVICFRDSIVWTPGLPVGFGFRPEDLGTRAPTWHIQVTPRSTAPAQESLFAASGCTL